MSSPQDKKMYVFIRVLSNCGEIEVFMIRGKHIHSSTIQWMDNNPNKIPDMDIDAFNTPYVPLPSKHIIHGADHSLKNVNISNDISLSIITEESTGWMS